MKTNLIQVGGIYHDGKLGVREVAGIERRKFTPDLVTYCLLAAKAEQEYRHADRAMVNLIGTTSTCDLESFARWAKVVVPADQKSALLADLAARKLRLPPGEAAFMASVAKSFDAEFPIKAGAGVSFNFNETRSARGIEKKGLATVAMAPPGAGGEITLTELGAAWCKLHASNSTEDRS